MDRFEIADKLHSAAIHLLRRLQRREPIQDSARRAIGPVVVVFAGPVTMSQLAAAEQVACPHLAAGEGTGAGGPCCGASRTKPTRVCSA